MKQRYHLFKRGNGVFYCLDIEKNRQTSLQTREVELARSLLNARNEACRQPAMNLEIARVYLNHSDPIYATRTWQQVMDEVARQKKGETQSRWARAMRKQPFDLIRHKTLVETKAQDFLDVLATGAVCTNIFLRRLHNYALEMDWLPKSVIPRRQWPKIEFKPKRGITPEEHRQIIAGEHNPEWRAFYQLLWHLGGAQSDVALLRTEDVDWEMKVVSFSRKKTGSVVQLHFGGQLGGILNDLPGEGFLAPAIAKMHEKDRAKQFTRRCRLTGISGVSLHS